MQARVTSHQKLIISQWYKSISCTIEIVQFTCFHFFQNFQRNEKLSLCFMVKVLCISNLKFEIWNFYLKWPRICCKFLPPHKSKRLIYSLPINSMMMANCVDFGWKPTAIRCHLIFAWITKEINCFGISTTVKDAHDVENALLITRKLKSFI